MNAIKVKLAVLVCLMASLPGSLRADDIAKTGIGVGPLPRVGYDPDNGFNGYQSNFKNI